MMELTKTELSISKECYKKAIISVCLSNKVLLYNLMQKSIMEKVNDVKILFPIKLKKR